MLPVFVPGGFLYLGDCHAAQGAGEVSGIALEMPARSRIVVGLEKGIRLPWPRIETDSDLMAIACGRPLDEAVGVAFGRLAWWLERSNGWARWEALSLLSQVGEVSLGYYWGAALPRKFPSRTFNEPRQRVEMHPTYPTSYCSTAGIASYWWLCEPNRRLPVVANQCAV